MRLTGLLLLGVALVFILVYAWLAPARGGAVSGAEPLAMALFFLAVAALQFESARLRRRIQALEQKVEALQSGGRAGD